MLSRKRLLLPRRGIPVDDHSSVLSEVAKNDAVCSGRSQKKVRWVLASLLCA